MFDECRNYLVSRLQDAGVRSRVITSNKRLKTCQDIRFAAVLFQNESFEFNGSKSKFEKSGTQIKRMKKYDRETSYTVMIGGGEPEEAEKIYQDFLAGLDEGITVDGNYVPLIVEDAEWLDGEDTILRSKLIVSVNIRFNGGIYKDTVLQKLGQVEISVDKGRR